MTATTTVEPLQLSDLFHLRWNAPILVALLEPSNRRVAVLLHKLDVSRNSLKASLAVLDGWGLVMRNPGYGHPLRPELLLTEHGRQVAEACRRLADSLDDTELTKQKWAAPVLAALIDTHHFQDLERRLGASPRALSIALRQLTCAELATRTPDPNHARRSTYNLTELGADVAAATQAVADALAPTNPPEPNAR